MKRTKRILAFALFLCLLVSMLPPVRFAGAAVVSQRYELDTDGIDPGATYLIVNTGVAGSGNALRFRYNSYWDRDFQNQTLTVKKEDGVSFIDAGFANEADCQFQFTAAGAGNITHGNYTVNLSDTNFVQGNPNNTLTFTNVGGGQYRIHYTYWWTTNYLRYNGSWGRTSSSSTVYLYKLTEHITGYNVTFDANGATSGQVPAGEEQLDPGTVYTLPKPLADLRKDIGEDTWLFLCWNTKADGTGIEYRPGEKITVTEDVTLYADWYQQTKHEISMITYLDGVPTDVDKFAGYDRHFYAQLEGTDTLIPMTRRSEGTYGAKVVENGTYIIYAQTADGRYETVHGHKIVVYNQTGTTECLHYSVTYDLAGGTWAEGEDPGTDRCHNGETVYTTTNVPTKAGYRFLGWMNQDGKTIVPGHPATEFADRKIVLTAVWEKLITVTVNVQVDHNIGNGWDRDESTRHKVSFTLLRVENNVNLPVAEKTLELKDGDYNQDTKITTYQVVFNDMPKGVYHVASTKTGYAASITYPDSGNEDAQVIDLNLQYQPDNIELKFDVVVNAESDAQKALKPKAVNVKVSCWSFSDGVLGWHIISQQAGTDNVPVTVMIDENGRGSGFFPVWDTWPEGMPYLYRVEVTSFVLPDGSIVPAGSSDHITYTPDGSGLYTAQVDVVDGIAPTYPLNSDTDLAGAYFVNGQQNGVPTVTIDVKPMTVTFHALDGLVNDQQTIVLENQYRYPALHDYVAVHSDKDRVFLGWADQDGNPVENLEDQLLPGDVEYFARYSEKLSVSGIVAVDSVYEQNGENISINEIDWVKKVLVVLQKRVGDVYNDVASQTVTLKYEMVEGYEHLVGLGEYNFTDLVNDGTEYRVHTLVLNYKSAYDNNLDETYTPEEAVALVDEQNRAKVNIHLDFAPDNYQQAIHVDASQIHKDFRPADVLVQLVYRDLGDVHDYKVISQHTAPPYGVMVNLHNDSATGMEIYDVWNWHTNGAPYEYQAQVSKVYGEKLPGADADGGLAYTASCPFTVVYGPANNFLKQELEGGVMLKATLVPKQYSVHLDLNLGDDPNTPVVGLEDFMVDDGTGNERYAFEHTWSYKDQFTAYPYREGYVFKGWKGTDPNGKYENGSYTDDSILTRGGIVHVGATLDHEVTLVAQWEKLTDTDYTVRYLELNTDKVLQGATAVSGAALGDVVTAADKAVSIEGYVYAGAMVDGKYIDKNDNPTMKVSGDPLKNLMIIYYLPDGSDGYTEQVESNLEINKTAALESNGTYTITMDTWTKDNPITTLIQQNTPLDIVLVLDQSGSLAANNFEYLNALQDAVENFVESVADHGRHNEVDHRIAMVGYAGNATDGHSSDPVKATGGKTSDTWINTGVFDSNGEYHLYNVKGFNYTELTNTSTMKADGIYYTKVTTNGETKYLLLTHHDEYRHLITEEEARLAVLQGQTVFGYVYNEQNEGNFVELTRNSSGLWLYGNKQLYSKTEFFTYHTDVWTHRDGLDRRQIHAYGVGAAYTPTDGHEGVYTREETTGSSFEQSIYKDALVPVSVGADGSGGTNPGLLKAIESFGADGATRASYGMEMANKVLEATPKEDDDRVRLVVMFTDGEPGYLGFDSSQNTNTTDYYQQAVDEANSAINHAYTSKNTYGAYVYAIGLYESAGVEATSDVAYYMNALSSNYPKAKTMNDIKASITYTVAKDGTPLQNNGKFFVLKNNTYYEVQYGYVRVSGSYWGQSQYCWYYKQGNTNYSITTATNPTVSGGKVNNTTIYQAAGGYAATENSGYYATTESADHLRDYFENVLRDITTKITTKIVLESDTILRDIMGQGLVLTPGAVVTAYKQAGEYVDGQVKWDEKLEYVASATIPDPMPKKVQSTEVTTVNYKQEDGTLGVKENVPYIQIYNLDSANPTNPNAPDYHPHTVDVTGYDFRDWYISETHKNGYKMVVTITGIEARDDVKWGVSTKTNNEQSGLWLPADEQENRQLLLPFDQPTTIFVERAYVLDYGKEFTLSGWYFDDEANADGQVMKEATPQHIDCDITNGMNWFDPENPNKTNQVGGKYGNTKYGNVELKDGVVTYTPTTTNWGGYDQFYVFGETWRKTVLAQDANTNGVPNDINKANLWNKVTVIPANNIYYEDSFITQAGGEQNGIEGFTFTGNWTVVGTNADGNTETPEHMESKPYGDVHGWTDSLNDDNKYTDGTAHGTGLNKDMGAKAEFTFTGTGVEVYTRTNKNSGMVFAMLYRKTKDSEGKESLVYHQSLAMDNLAMSGDYYHIPTVSFTNLPYGTYKVELIATAASTATGNNRYEYYIDGIRVYNPLGNAADYQDQVVKDAYGLEVNAVFTEVRDILLDNNSFTADQAKGAVFIDWIREGQGSGEDNVGTGVPTYELGTFEKYGPKNEVYLSAGQAIVLKVAEGNNYFMGMKSLTGGEVTVNVSGIDNQDDPTQIKLSHTTDMYYQVTPVNGYLVIQNGNTKAGAILSITTLRTTNLTAPAPNGGILPVTEQEAVEMVTDFSAYLVEKENKEEPVPPPSEPEEEIPSADEQAQANLQFANTLFTTVRQWLDEN